MLRFLTSGESHGRCLSGLLEGLPSGVPIDTASLNEELGRRQAGYGRGGRMAIERDRIDITGGVRHGKTIGSPVSFLISNRDWAHWETVMSVEPAAEESNLRPVSRPRPGHADLAGALKYQTHDVRNILERASARETAARVGVGALCKEFLKPFEIRALSHVLAIGSVRADERFWRVGAEPIASMPADAELRCLDSEAQARMIATIDEAKRAGDSLGGIVEVVVAGIPPGLGSHIQWDRKLDGLLAQALMSIPSAKGVEIGEGVSASAQPGSRVHDEIFYDAGRRAFLRGTNHAGGLEGGVTNGCDLRARIYLKPIPTLRKPLRSVDLETKAPFEAAYERSDTCVVPAAGVIAEAMASFVVARAFLEKFGGDSLEEVRANFLLFQERLRAF